MGGLFGVVARRNCTHELFYGVDYHSHLGTRRGGMATYGPDGFHRAIHNIENSPFRTKFERDVEEMTGYYGIACISDFEPQPIIIQSHLGSFAIATVGKVNNYEQLIQELYDDRHTHFQEMTNGQVNVTELIGALICRKDSLLEGIRYVQDIVDGSMTMLLLKSDGIYAARDKVGRTPLVIGHKEDAYCVSMESFAYLNLGYTDERELGPGEVVRITPDGIEQLAAPGEEMQICQENGIPVPVIRRFEPPELVYKKCVANVIVVAKIPPDAQVRGQVGKKCRADKATIVDIIGDFCGEKVGISIHDMTTAYFIGDEVVIDDFDQSDEECSTGFHFFCTREEAERY